MTDVERFRAAAPLRIRGTVDSSSTARGLYATDASNYRHVPVVVVTPVDIDDLVATVALCCEHNLPVTIRGGGTSIAGNATGTGVVIDTSRNLHRILNIDPVARTATVEPGVVLDRINEAAAAHGLCVGPDPSTHARCTIGGMIANNACGAHSMSSGRTDDCVRSLDVLLYDGTRFRVTRGERPAEARTDSIDSAAAATFARLKALATENADLLRTAFPQFPRRVSGYALDVLLPERGFDVVRALVGTEGTLVTVLEATIDLVPLPAAKVLVVAGFADDLAAADAVPALIALAPAAIEGIDRELVNTFVRAQRTSATPDLPPGQGWLLVEVVGDDTDQARAHADDVIRTLTNAAAFFGAVVHTEPVAQRAMWAIREKGAGLATRLPDGSEAWPGWEDAAVPPAHLGAYLRDFRALQERTGIRGVTYGHFGDGCIHTRLAFDLSSTAGVAQFRAFIEEAADIVVRHGGSLSGEHGDGQARSEMLAKMYPPAVIDLFAEFKAIFDPLGRMNPGVVVRPRPIDADLRVGPRSARLDDGSFRPLAAGEPSEGPRRTRPAGLAFAYEADHGDFERAVRRCVGVGACRNERGGVMCPSFRVTHDEVHSTRGRAHLLHEMIEGDVIVDGWRSTEVRDALDLCLGCKGCKSDCPVGVDVAAYKSEFLHQHYRRRRRPASHYSLGNLPLLARVVARAPRVANALLARRSVAAVVRKVSGIDPRRPLPRFAERTLTRWFRSRPTGPMVGDPNVLGQTAPGPTVLLWPDTFTNHFTPWVGEAAVSVLESAGITVVLPDRAVCCGLTWISTGQLAMARRVLLRTLMNIAAHAADDSYVVGLEPSCVSALRTDLPELLPDHPIAAWLSTHVLTFAEAIERFAPTNWAPQAAAQALVQTHCHQHATLGTDADRALMRRVGIDATTLDAGCCGMAGNFGFERAHYDTAMAVGELGVLPAVRAANDATVVLADGFSCRMQIDQATDRRAVHLAELIAQALDHDRSR